MSKLKKLFRSPSLYFRDFFARRCGAAWTECGIHETAEPEAMALQERMERLGPQPDFPIDAVFTHVDGSDPAWREARAAWEAEARRAMPAAADKARFLNLGEIVRSVPACAQNMPFVRRIFIVSGQLSGDEAWLPGNAVIVRPEEIVDPQYLPTFNSHVLEACLWRIPDLAEHFVYFNDDVFALRPCPASHYFSASGSAKLYATVKSIGRMARAGRGTPTLAATLNSFRLLGRPDLDMPLAHSRFPLLKSAYEAVWRTHGQEIEAFLPRRFRSPEDLNLATCLVPWTAFFGGRGELSFDVCWYFDVASRQAPLFYKALLARRGTDLLPQSMCCNLGLAAGLSKDAQDAFSAFLDEFFA